MSLLLPFFHWADHSTIGLIMRNSIWLFPFIEAFHLVALAILGGTILIVDMRLVGLGLRNQPASQLARDVQPWMVGGLVVMLASGFLLFLSEPMKLYDNLPFQIKMVSLLVAIVYTFTLRRRLANSDVNLKKPFEAKMAAVVSVVLWSVVGLMGRGIGFY